MPRDIARFYQQCDPAEPLPPRDPRYVPGENVRGVGDVVTYIADAFRFSSGTEKILHILFAGHRGGGKSTELLRLKDSLENPPDSEDKFFVVYFEADREDNDVNDADFPDLLLAMIRQVGKAMRERERVELRPGWLARFVDDLRHLLGSEVQFESLELDAKIARFTATIKHSPDARVEIRKALEPNVSNLIEAANSLLDEAVTRLKAMGYSDLVLIVDNLDRIVLRDLGGGINTHERLFINRADHLNSLWCHIVYTLPLSIVFTHHGPRLSSAFGRPPHVLPMVRVIKRDGKDDEDGIRVMGGIVRQRLQAAGVAEGTAFDSSDTLNYLCRMSGGHARNLLILLRSACEQSGSFPLKRDVVERVVRGMGNDFERALSRPEYFDVLRKVDETHDLPGSEHDQLLLYNLSILEYLNDRVWYAVNPAVRLLEKFNSAPRSRRRRTPSTAQDRP